MKLRIITIVTSGVFLLLMLTQCSTEPEKMEITLTNNSEVSLTDKAVSIDRGKITLAQPDNSYPLIISADGDIVASQLNDLDDDNNWDELFFVVDLPAKGKETLSLQWTAEMPKYVVRTSARFGKRPAADIPVKPALTETLLAADLPKSLGYQRYQTDGPSWENDKVGFRHYLDGRNAKDLFGKKTSAMSPETVGINADGAVEDNYHVMEDWGRDILSVGNSLGLGGYGLKAGDKLMRLGVTVDDAVNNVDTTLFKITAEGPVNSVLSYNYKNWIPEDGRVYQVEETTNIWPGMYAYQNSVQMTGLKGDEELIIGLVNRDNQNPVQEFAVNDEWQVILTHDMQGYNREWWIGMALIIPTNYYLGLIEAPQSGDLSTSYLAKIKIQNNKPVTYFAVAGWELSDERFIKSDYFINYVENLVQQISTKVEVTIK